jgi:hypothetical protein
MSWRHLPSHGGNGVMNAPKSLARPAGADRAKGITR